MLWFVLSVIGFVLFTVMAVLASTAPRREQTPPDVGIWDLITGDAAKKLEREADAQQADQVMTVILWLIALGLLVASVVTGVQVFGGAS